MQRLKLELERKKRGVEDKYSNIEALILKLCEYRARCDWREYDRIDKCLLCLEDAKEHLQKASHNIWLSTVALGS